MLRRAVTGSSTNRRTSSEAPVVAVPFLELLADLAMTASNTGPASFSQASNSASVSSWRGSSGMAGPRPKPEGTALFLLQPARDPWHGPSAGPRPDEGLGSRSSATTRSEGRWSCRPPRSPGPTTLSRIVLPRPPRRLTEHFAGHLIGTPGAGEAILRTARHHDIAHLDRTCDLHRNLTQEADALVEMLTSSSGMLPSTTGREEIASTCAPSVRRLIRPPCTPTTSPGLNDSPGSALQPFGVVGPA